MEGDGRLVSQVSRRRITELVDLRAVVERACQMLAAQAPAQEGHSVQVAVEQMRALAPMTLLELMEAEPPSAATLEALGRTLHAVLALAWVIEVKFVATRPF